MSKTVVGIDIGTSSLRAVEVRNPGKPKPTIARYHEVPLPEGAARAGEVLEPHTVASALKKLWSDGNFRSKNVVLGMGNQRVLARDLAVPRASIKQIRQSLPFQVQDLLPVPVADAVLDFYPISEEDGENGPVVNGLLVAATKDAVMANVTAVALAGLSAVEVDLIPFALARVYLSTGSSPGTVAIVDIGASTTNIAIVTDGVPEFVRIIPVGGAELTRALSERLALTVEQAEQVKRGLGILSGQVPPEHQQAAEVIYSVTRELLTSIANTLNYYTTAHPERPVDGLVLSGGGAQLAGFAVALGEFARIPVIMADPFGGVAVERAFANSKAAGPTNSMTVALGLAIGSAA